MKTLIKHGHLVNETYDQVIDLLLVDGKVAKVAPNIEQSADMEVVEATGKFIFPGGIDAHTHMELPIRDFFSVDDFRIGTQAALAGGTTTIIDFANQSKGESLHTTLDKWLEKSKKAVSPVFFHVSVTDVNEQTLQEMEQLHLKRGINSFKTFLAYKGMRLNDEQMRKVLRKSKELDTIVTAHCELGEEVEANIEQLIKKGNTAPKFHPLSRPADVEGRATAHFLALAQEEQAAAYVVHMSCQESVEALKKAKGQGQECFGETCIQYLLLDDSVYEQEFEQASRYILSPPLRDKSNQDVLWQALRDGIIDVVATDHCPFSTGLRQLGRDDFRLIPNGIGGVEERMILLFSEGVMKKRISRKKFVEVSAINPAKRFGLYPQKGALVEGSDADFIIIDPNKKWILTNEQLHHSCDYSCYAGKHIQGKIEQVYLAGKVL